MRDYNIAIYIRLSMADEDTGKGKAESDSIANQRSLINRYLDRNQALCQCRRTEFHDDGFSGTNTDRPAFTDMMSRVKKGEFNLIVVKDFSRFSRDYIEIGDCLECLFPFLGVRFISINDNYDSEDYKGTTGGMDVVMRNIVYAAYSKDLSMKTTTAKIQRMKQGQYVGGYAPYGFAFHPTERNKLVADPESAAIVRRIFALAIDGKTPTEIAKMLNAEEIPTPGQYFASKHPDTKKFSSMSDSVSWTYKMVRNILRKRAYTGAAVGHVRKIAAPLSRKTVQQDEADWIIVEGAHEAIVSPEEFEQAQKIFKKVSTPATHALNLYPLRSLVRCGYCGRLMEHTQRKAFRCSYGQYNERGKCDSSIMYPESDLEQVIFGAIQMLLQAAATERKSTVRTRDKNASDIQQRMKILSDLQKQSEKLKSQKLSLYEQYSSGEISKQVYLERKSSLSERITQTDTEIEQLENDIAQLELLNAPEENEFDSAAKAYKGETHLTYDMAHAFIRAIYVFPDGRREIEWKFKDIADSIGYSE